MQQAEAAYQSRDLDLGSYTDIKSSLLSQRVEIASLEQAQLEQRINLQIILGTSLPGDRNLRVHRMKPQHNLAAWLVLLLATVAASPVMADEATTASVLKTLQSRYSAPAQVQPLTMLQITAPIAGQVSGLQRVPGEMVNRGEPLARLAGAGVESDIARLRADLKIAQDNRATAYSTLKIVEQKFADRLSTRDDLLRAKSAASVADQQWNAARQSVAAHQSLSIVAAPVRGVLSKLTVSDGQYVNVGQALMTMAPLDKLRVVASFYGTQANAVRAGMKGTFLVSDTSQPIAVTVQQTAWNATTPGRLDAWLIPAGSASLRLGQTGSIELVGVAQTLPAIPSQALIFDQGQWWVVVRDKSGDHHRRVTPGLSTDGWTGIESGLNAGESVVTVDPYLTFHEEFSKRYQQQD